MAAEFKRRSCQSGQRLSKPSLLAMLGEPPLDGESFSNNASRAFFERIPNENWDIISFDVITRNVCVSILTNYGVHTISVILPPLSVSKV